LYHSGRRADALDTYRRVARGVSDTFGLDPGPELKALLERILNDDLVEEPEAPLDVTKVIPRQLPPAQSPVLAGRAAELGWLDALPAGALAVVTGAPGVGKSALVVSWAHRA